MGEDISLIQRYLDICNENSETINESLGIENNVVRFIIPSRIDFSLSQPEIQEAYPLDEFRQDIESKMPYIKIKRKLIYRIEQMATERLSDLNVKSEGFQITPQEMPNAETARWFRTSPTQILNYYKKEIENIKEDEELIDEPEKTV